MTRLEASVSVVSQPCGFCCAFRSFCLFVHNQGYGVTVTENAQCSAVCRALMDGDRPFGCRSHLVLATNVRAQRAQLKELEPRRLSADRGPRCVVGARSRYQFAHLPGCLRSGSPANSPGPAVRTDG